MARIAAAPGTFAAPGVPGASGVSGVPGVSGLGMAAASLARTGRPARVTQALYCPPAARHDPALAATVQQDVDTWAAAAGVAAAPVAGLGRLVVLAHPDTTDPRRLAVAARLLALGRILAATALGTRTEDLLRPAPIPETAPPDPARILQDTLADVYDGCDTPTHSPTDPGPSARAAATALTTAAAADPVAPVRVSAMSALSALPASPYQMERVRREYEALASLGSTGASSPWERLSLSHINAFSPALAALDAVNGYELAPQVAYDPQMQRAHRLAASAAALLHDIASPTPTGLTAAIAHAEGIGAGAAGRRAAQIHDETMRAFQRHAEKTAAGCDPATGRHLDGLWTWLGGHRSWHAQP